MIVEFPPSECCLRSYFPVVCFCLSIGRPGEILNRITKMNYTKSNFKVMRLILQAIPEKINAIAIITLKLLVKKSQHKSVGLGSKKGLEEYTSNSE